MNRQKFGFEFPQAYQNPIHWMDLVGTGTVQSSTAEIAEWSDGIGGRSHNKKVYNKGIKHLVFANHHLVHK